MRLPFLVLAIFAIAPPVAAQQSAPDSTAIAALDSAFALIERMRADIVRLRGFNRSVETMATKVLADADATAVALRAVPKPVVPKPAPPPADTVPTPPDTAKPAPKPAPTPPTSLPASTVALPRATVDITLPLTTGNLWPVTSAAALRMALDSAKAGDVVELEPGVVYAGSFTLRNRGDTGWVVIRTRGFAIPQGQRVRPADSVTMARLVSPGSNQPALTTSGAAQGWRLVGIEVTQAPGAVVGSLVSINGHDAKTPADQPRRIILDRVLIRSRPELDVRRCVTLNGAELAVIDSWLDECHANGADSQAILAWAGSGPFLIQNNHLAGAGENVMFGGSDSRSAELMPADITIRGNHFYKPLSWKKDHLLSKADSAAGLVDGIGWLVKNLLEFKVGRRVLVESNVFENAWPDGQTGTALVMKTSNQSGTAPWSETSDVTVVGNVVLNATNGINLAGRPESAPAVPASRFHFANNVIQSGGRHVLVQGVDSVTVTANTFAPGSHGVLFTGTQRGFVATANLWGTTQYPITADAKGYGSVALANAAPGAVWSANAMQSGAASTMYPQPGTVVYKAGDALPVNTGATLDVAALIRRVVGPLP